ncbi:MAG: bifunctional [glutamate--ammonia ligase]-adenylyl-L-tyrosine phosphorylase/[glutamate--ammonia-ligase] adenylyltransferase, partial [Vibrionaceae bacterium]
VEQTWLQMRAKYGEPAHLANCGRRGFMVLAFGKLGGIELGYASDLDLVFLYDAQDDEMSDGAKSISAQQFYLRLAQRIVHLFAARTAAGVLYELDMRLRPSGEAGLLITSMASFANYQREKAWTWEHQTLVRARAIFGDEKMCQQFEALREEILCTPRALETLKEQVHAMRQKMREHQRAPADKSSLQYWLFTLKQGRGGIIDIEFLAQFWVLAFAHKVPKIATWSDNMRILDDLALHEIVDAAQVQSLQSAYLCLRTEIHRVSLLQADPNAGLSEALPPAAESSFKAVFAAVEAVWQQWLGS